MFLFILAGLGLAFHFGSAEVRRFERAAADEIKSKLEGSSPTVQVQVKPTGIVGGAWGDLFQVDIQASDFSTKGLPLFTEPDRSKMGRIKTLNIILRDFDLANLHIQQLDASIPDCRYDFRFAVNQKKMRLSQSGLGTGAVQLSSKDLEHFILKKYREIKSVHVSLRKDKAFVDGYGEFLFVKTRFSVIAALEPVDGTKFCLTSAYIFFGDERADPFASKALLDVLNPVVDLNKDLKLFDAIKIVTIKLDNETLTASGRTQIPVMPKGQ